MIYDTWNVPLYGLHVPFHVLYPRMNGQLKYEDRVNE